MSSFSTVGLFARPPSHLSSQSQESALPSSPSRMGLDQSFTSHSSVSSGVSEATRNLPTSPSSLVIKEEPRDVDTVLIKWEMSEERLGEHQERLSEHQQSTGSPCQDQESSSVESNVSYLYPVIRYNHEMFCNIRAGYRTSVLCCTYIKNWSDSLSWLLTF